MSEVHGASQPYVPDPHFIMILMCLAVPLDVLSRIMHDAVWDMTKRQIFTLKDASKDFHRIFLQYMYRHIHLSYLDDSINCLETIAAYSHLRYHVRTLAVSVDTTREDTTGSEYNMKLDIFLTLLRTGLPGFINLQCLNIFYYHDDTDALFRWVCEGLLSLLPSSIRKVSFIPLDEGHSEVGEGVEVDGGASDGGEADGGGEEVDDDSSGGEGDEDLDGGEVDDGREVGDSGEVDEDVDNGGSDNVCSNSIHRCNV